ncbi:MAG: hypothetical protein R3Y07_09590 [Eubacteriales bacterium]
MWTPKKSVREKAGYQGTVDRGAVTQSGSNPSVYLDREQRNLTVCGPKGYHWVPSQGDDAVVTRTEDGAGFVVGTVNEVDGLRPEEIGIYTETSGQILLTRGMVELSGGITINGMDLDQYIYEVIYPPPPDPDIDGEANPDIEW